MKAINVFEAEYQKLYKKLLFLHKTSRVGHIGGSISALPVVYVLFSGVFNVNTDKLVFSKGHTVTALYCTLALRGLLPGSDLEQFYSDGGRLGGHPPKYLTQFCPFATGSLGHGSSLAAGLALGKKLKGEQGRIFCICGDGEWQEGACWEALIFCVRHHLDNITFVVDCNGWQGFGAVSDVAGYDEKGLERRLTAFGAHVEGCSAYDFERLASLLVSSTTSVPSFLLTKSCKGKGLPNYEDTLASHYVQISDSLYDSALEKLEYANEK